MATKLEKVANIAAPESTDDERIEPESEPKTDRVTKDSEEGPSSTDEFKEQEISMEIEESTGTEEPVSKKDDDVEEGVKESEESVAMDNEETQVDTAKEGAEEQQSTSSVIKATVKTSESSTKPDPNIKATEGCMSQDVHKMPEKVPSTSQKGVDNVFECRVCNKFYAYSFLKKHVVQHTKRETEVCSACGYFGMEGGPMTDHPSCFVCWGCNIFFKSALLLRDHLAWHNQVDNKKVETKETTAATKKGFEGGQELKGDDTVQHHEKEVDESVETEAGTQSTSTSPTFTVNIVESDKESKLITKSTETGLSPNARKSKRISIPNKKYTGETDMLECRVCHKYFVYTALKKHVVQHTDKETEVCCRCGYFSKEGGPMTDHPSCFVCWGCNIFFKSYHLLKDHMAWHKKVGEKTNETAAKKKDEEELRGSDKLLTGEKEGEESNETEARSDLTFSAPTLTVEISESDPEYKLITKATETLDAQEMAMKDRNEQEVLECRVCHKYFVYSSLKQHVVQHTNKETEVCPACGYFGKDGGKMGVHPSCFVCWGCNIFFKSYKAQKDHMAWHKEVEVDVKKRVQEKTAEKNGGGEEELKESDAMHDEEVEAEISRESELIAQALKGFKVKEAKLTALEPCTSFGSTSVAKSTATLKRASKKVSGNSQKTNSEEQVLECRICHDFFFFSSLKEHVIQHTGKYTDVCSSCGYYEICGGPVTEHPSCFVCWTCSVFFKSSTTLREHMQLHDIPDENEEWHTCMICMARFCNARGLGNHIKWHGEGSVLLEKQILKQNRKDRKLVLAKRKAGKLSGLIVTSEGLQKDDMKLCIRCNMFFKSQRSLRKHVRREHTHTKTELCEKCGFFEEAGGPLGIHDCEVELGKLKNKRVRKKKIPGERYTCKLCSKTYAFRNGLRAHLVTHKAVEDLPYCCNVCPKKFAKKICRDDHLRVHTGEKPYLCHKCAKTFRSGSNLRQHSKRCKAVAPPFKSAGQPSNIPPLKSRFKTPINTFIPGVEQPQSIIRLQPGTHHEEQPIVFEVQMQVVEEGDNAVVINLDEISNEIRNYTQRTAQQYEGQTNMGTQDFEVVLEPEMVTEKKPERLGDVVQTNMGTEDFEVVWEPAVALEKKQERDAFPVSIYTSPTKLPVGQSNVAPDRQEESKAYDVIDDASRSDIEMNADDDDDDWGDEEGQRIQEELEASIPLGGATTNHDDHDYVNMRENPSSAKEEKDNEKPEVPRLIEIMFMCPLCKGLFEDKFEMKNHIQSIHKNATKFDGIVVLAQPRGNSKEVDSDSDSDSEDELAENRETMPIEWSYSCSHCFETFSEDEIGDHLKTVKLTKGQCKVCFRNHKHDSKIYQAKVRCKLSRARKVYKCPYCDSIKKVTLHELKAHLKIRHITTKFSCKLCDKTFTAKRSLGVHQRAHTREAKPKVKKPAWTCDKCGKVVNDQPGVRIHKMQHVDPKPFRCKLCPKAYTFPTGLTVHMRGHNNNFPFLCEYCSRAFKTKGCLMSHIRCHTGAKPFDCEGCGKWFRTKGNLRQHRQRCIAIVGRGGYKYAASAKQDVEISEMSVEEISIEAPYFLLVPDEGKQ